MKKASINIPVYFKEIALQPDRKEDLKNYNGELVLIKDSHFQYEDCLGTYKLARLRIDKNDNECYYAQFPYHSIKTKRFGRSKTTLKLKETRLHYHDLEGLLVSEGRSVFSLEGIEIKPFDSLDT